MRKFNIFGQFIQGGGGRGIAPIPPPNLISEYANGQEVTGKFEYFSSRKQKPCHYYYEWTSSEE